MDPVVLFFLLGAFARLAKSDLRLPEALYETLSIYLLLAIGLITLAITLVLGVLVHVPVAALFAVPYLRRRKVLE